MRFTDDKARQMLRLLHEYCEEFSPDIPQTIPALAWDLSSSLDQTSDEDDRMYQEIEQLCS